MKKLFFIPILLLAVAAVGQQRPMQSLYMFDPLLINPAYAGTQVQLSATGIYRNQWVNFPGAPKTFTATAHSGFRKTRAGVGLIVGRDVIGVHGETSLYLAYSYKLPISKYSKTTVSFGVQGGFNELKSDYLQLSPKQPDNYGILRNMSWNFGGGIFLRAEKFYAGFSVPYGLNNVVVDLEDPNLESTAQQKRYYYLTGGYTFTLSPLVKVIPSGLFRFQEQAPVSFDLNTIMVLYDVVGLGVSVRNGGGWSEARKGFKIDAVVGMFELQINENFHVGYAYDFTASDIAKFSSGTHEVMINYRIKIAKIHKGLECPAYW